MKITGIRRQKRNGSRVNLYIDGEYRLSVASEVALRWGLRRGADVDDATIVSLERADTTWATRETALRLLGVRPRSREELRRRLERKGFSQADIELCLDRLGKSGLVDDREFARIFTRERLRSRPKGRAALRAELRARGVGEADAESALNEAFAGEQNEEAQLARRAARRFPRRAREQPLATKRRLYAYLARRGFSGEAIRSVIAEDGL